MASKDVFVSHASEDKDTIVSQVVDSLARHGITYWLDLTEVQAGEDIARDVGDGLKTTKHILIVVSESFLRKRYPRIELEAAIGLEKEIIPVIVGGREVEVAFKNEFPLLAGKRFIYWEKGPDYISEEICNVLNKDMPSPAIINRREEVVFQDNNRALIWTTIILLSLALAVDVASIPLGLAWGSEGYSYNVGGYLQKWNWVLFPLFFPILAAMVNMSWSMYMRAWATLPEHNLLYRNGIIDFSYFEIRQLLLHFSYMRVFLVFASAFLGLLLTAVDAGELWVVYGVIPGEYRVIEPDFTIAHLFGDIFKGVNRNENGIFIVCAYLLQGALIAYAWLALFQIVLHGMYFMSFERTRIAKENGLTLRLNTRDKLCEFGLSEVNRALNAAYIFIALSLVIAVISSMSQKPDEKDLGQWLMAIFLPLLLAAPLIIPIFDRAIRIKEASDRVANSEDIGQKTDYNQQRLWPLDRTQIAFVGKIFAAVAIMLYVISFLRLY